MYTKLFKYILIGYWSHVPIKIWLVDYMSNLGPISMIIGQLKFE